MTVAAVGAVSRAAAGGAARTTAAKTATKKTATKTAAASSKTSRGTAGSARGKRSTSRAGQSPGRSGSSGASTVKKDDTAQQVRKAVRDVESAKKTGGTITKNIVPLRVIRRVNQSGHYLATGPRRFLVAEFLICMVLVTIGPLAESRRGESSGTWLKRASAIFGIFFVLGLITTGGRSAAKAAAGFGGVVAVAMLVTNRDAIVTIGKTIDKDSGDDVSGPSEDITEPDSAPDGPTQPAPRPTSAGGVNPSRPGPDGPG
jgi:hypothetical protein